MALNCVTPTTTTTTVATRKTTDIQFYSRKENEKKSQKDIFHKNMNILRE